MFFHSQILPYYWISERGGIIAQCTEENNIHRRFVINLNVFVVFFYKPTILVKTFGTLRVSGKQNVIEVDPLPPEQYWVLQVKHLLCILHMLRTSNLFKEVGGKSC